MKNTNKKQRFRIFVFTFLLILIISISGFVVYAMQSVSIPLEVKEPLQILEYPTSFSLYPGETLNFNFTVENSASVNYFQEFEFLVNDTDYKKYVKFSNYNYSIPPGIHNLNAWFTIAPSAPAANFEITIRKKIDTQVPSPSQTNQTNTSQLLSLQLLSGGARWASPNGTKALYVNHKDNYEAHRLTDGIDWGPWAPEATMNTWKSSITKSLEQVGFKVAFAADIPEELSDFNLVVIKANWAVEPKHAELIKDYLSNGGAAVILKAVPCYLSVYCKDWHPGVPGTDLTQIKDWFGSDTYVNTGGQARLIVDNPFGTNLKSNDLLYTALTNYEAAVTSFNENVNVIATWGNSNYAYAFTYEYGQGRIYYQGEVIPTFS